MADSVSVIYDRVDICQMISRGNVARVKELYIQKHMSATRQYGEGGLTLLHYAAWHNQVQVMEFLLTQGATVDQLSSDKRTSLFLAALYGGVDAIRCLYIHGANFNHQDEDGDTPLHSGVYSQKEEVVRILLQCGADPNIKNHEGQTPTEDLLYPTEEVLSTPDVWKEKVTEILRTAITKSTRPKM